MTRAAGESWQHRRMRGDYGSDKALSQTSNVSITHTPETLNCELIVDPEVMQLINWQFQV
jgi:hypothetical protein